MRYFDRFIAEYNRAVAETGYPPTTIRVTRNAMREICIEHEIDLGRDGSDPPTAVLAFMGVPIVLIENEE